MFDEELPKPKLYEWDYVKEVPSLNKFTLVAFRSLCWKNGGSEYQTIRGVSR